MDLLLRKISKDTILETHYLEIEESFSGDYNI